MNSVKINLLPQEIRKKRIAEKGFIVLAGIVVVVIGVCVIVAVLLIVKAGSEEAKANEIKARVAVVDKEISEYAIYKKRQEEVEAHQGAIDETKKNEIYWYRFINELSMIVPSDIALSSLEIDETGDISFDGACFEYITVAEFLVRLNDMSMIKDIWLQKVEIKELEIINIVGKVTEENASEETIYGVNFSISANLRNPFLDSESVSTTDKTTTGSSSKSDSSSNKSDKK